MSVITSLKNFVVTFRLSMYAKRLKSIYARNLEKNVSFNKIMSFKYKVDLKLFLIWLIKA